MLTLSLLVSKDRETFFLKRLYSSPMKAFDFVLGYALVGLIIGIFQTIITIIVGFIISIVTKVEFISILDILLLIVTQLPMLITSIFLGILIGTIFSDKSAPGISSIFISLSGILGGCWMPIDTMGGFETFCKFLPFYPSVYLGRIATSATKTFGELYLFDSSAKLLLIPLLLFSLLSVILSCVCFKKSMISDN
jgi:ABC-2 type transport system permease protein